MWDWFHTWKSMNLAQPFFDARRLGRYTAMLLSNMGIIIFGFGTAFVNSFHQYLFFRFGVSQALVGHSICSMTLSEARLHRMGCMEGSVWDGGFWEGRNPGRGGKPLGQ